MDINGYLLLALVLAVLIIVYLISKLRRVRTQRTIIKDATNDIKSGNLNRRVLAQENDLTKRCSNAITSFRLKRPDSSTILCFVWRRVNFIFSESMRRA